MENSFVLPKLTNGPIEGVNNHIKVMALSQQMVDF
nr:transposase [Ligilactobacillus salivarius]